MKHCTIKTKDGLFVRIPRRTGETWLPLVHTHTYLGCKISYHCFEKQTLQYRMQIGTTAFQRLRPWLAKRHSVSTYTRAQVWKSCILSSYLHGLAAAGITQEGFHKLTHKCHAQLRLLGQSPGHITHETNADLFHRLALVDPAVYIQDQWTQLYHRLARQQAHFSRHDFMRHLPLDAIRSRVLSVFEHVQVQPQVWTLPCPYCPQLFDSMTSLNRHLVLTHKITRHKQSFLPVRDAQQGRPQCRHCHFKFYDWRGLKRHIVSDSCPLYAPDLPAQAPPADRPIFREHAQAGAWLALIEDVNLVQILREHCVLCGQYFFTGKSLLEHLNHHHYEMWSESKTLAPIINDALRDSKPCQACGKSIVKAHACHVVRQMAIIHALHTSNRRAEDTVQGKPVAPTPPKPDPTWQIPESGLRVKAQSSTAQSFKIINTYHPGRDSADGTSTCAHCQCVQGNHFALRRHIESGCCRAFNALRPLGKHIPQTWPELMSLARNADTAQILNKSTYTQALRTVCALCGRHCAKPGSLHQHLLQDHATIVHAAEARVMNMQTQANALGRPCYCGNRIVRKGHQCVIFAQIGLLQVVASKETSTASDVSNPDPAMPSGQVNHKDDPVLDFWADPAHCSSLNTKCVLCQIPLSAADVEQHLLTSHATLGARAIELYPSCLSPKPDCCRYCLESDGIVEYCPAALQLAFSQAHLASSTPLTAHDGNLRDSRRRHDGANAGCSRGHIQQFFKAKPQEGPPGGSLSGDTGCHRPPSEDGEPPHSFELETRIPATGPSLDGSVPMVLSDEPKGHSSSAAQPNSLLETRDGEESNPETTSSCPLPTGLSDRARQDADFRETFTDKSGVGTSHQGSAHHLRGDLAVPPMVPGLQESQSDVQTGYQHGQNAETPGGPGGGSSIRPQHPSLQGIEEHLRGDQASASMPIPTSCLPPREHNLGSAQPTRSQLDLAGHSGQGEATHTEREPFGHFLSQILEPTGQNVRWPIQQEEVKGAVMALRLINPENLCFVHATILAFFWGFIHLQHGKWMDLGGAARILMDLCTRSSLWVDTRDLECWSAWLAQWDDGRQHDSHEFLKAFLAFVQPPALTGSWVRKMHSDNRIKIMDHGTACHAHAKKVSLQELIDEWHTYMGMITAFERDSPLLCFQIDRFKPDSQGDVVKAAWHLDLTIVEVPIATEPDSLTTEVCEYVPMAGLLRKGHDQCGHLQCVARHARGWLVFDDNTEAVLHPGDQPPRQADWICVWLLRLTRYREVTPTFYVRGHDAKVHELVQLLDRRNWQQLETERLTRYFAVHCGACAQLFLDVQSLAKRVFLRHFQYRWILTRTFDLLTLDHRHADTPCLMCGALPEVTGGMRNVPTHACPAILNYALAKSYHQHELQHYGPIYGAPCRRDGSLYGAHLDGGQPEGLNEWLQMDPGP